MSFEELFVKEIKLSSEFVISSKPQIDHLQNVFLSVTDKKEQDAYWLLLANDAMKKYFQSR